MDRSASTPPSGAAARRLHDFLAGPWDTAHLVDFHTRHKLELFSHHVQNYRSLGRLVASAGSAGRTELESRYRALFLQTLAVPQTRRRHVDTMSHALGHLRGRADDATRRELKELIEQYSTGTVELDDVRAELCNNALTHNVQYLADQSYFADLRASGGARRSP